MSLSRQLLALILVFAPMSLLSFGGGQTLVPEIQHQSVTLHHWLSDTDFADLYGLARAAPGPSTLIVALIGWQVGGFLGRARSQPWRSFCRLLSWSIGPAPGGDAIATPNFVKRWSAASPQWPPDLFLPDL